MVFRVGDTLELPTLQTMGISKALAFSSRQSRGLLERVRRSSSFLSKGVSNQKVIELFCSSHIVADQFVAGFHGYTALEAMALGRPVLCFLRNDQMMIDPATCPIINTRPEEIYSVLKKCLSGQIDLNRLGGNGRRYVEQHYSLEAVAVRLGQLYIDTANFPVDIIQSCKAASWISWRAVDMRTRLGSDRACRVPSARKKNE